MGNQVCCIGAGASAADIDHFSHAHSHHRRGDWHRRKQGGAGANDDAERGRRRYETIDGLPLSKHGPGKVPSYVRKRLSCLLQDRRSTDFSRAFVPSSKSQLAAQMNKNGFKISTQPFNIVKLGPEQ